MNNISKIINKRILVTGGAGFIGSNLCEDLLKYNNEVICLDNFSTGKIENIQELLNNKNFILNVGDIRKIEDCKKAVDGVDIIFHEAALGSVPRSINDPITSNEVNIVGFLNMLIAARDAKISRFIYAASSSTYGDSESLPKVEEKIGKPLSPYAVTKYVNELYAQVFGKIYGLNTIGLRYFNVFGPKQDPNGPYAAVIPKFIISLILHKQPIIYGDGSKSRDFTYIENVIQMNHLAGISQNIKTVNQVFNTAVEENNDINSLYKIIKRNLIKYDPEISKIEVVYGPNREGDIYHSLASVEKAKLLLGYKPETNLENGILMTIPWYFKKYGRVNN